MKRLGLAVMMVALVLTLGHSAFAFPTSGANCASCHSGARGTMTITGNDTTANPTEACGSPDRGTLKVFTVTAGSTKTLSGTLSGVTSGAKYTAVVKGFHSTGVGHCGALTYAGDSTWKLQNATAPVYYTQPLTGSSYTWPGTSTFSFNIAVPANAAPDYYDLVLASGGKDSSGRFYTETHFYVNVAPPAAAPSITLNKTSLAATAVQGASPADDTFTVANGGTGTLSYTVSSSAAWLTVSPVSGSSSGPANTHTVQFSTASLAEGTYPATITVAAAGVTNTPQTISVSLTIAPPAAVPNITLNKSFLTATAVQGASPADDTFTVANGGTGTLSYTVSSSAAWLTVSPVSGSSSGPANTHTVQFSTASLAEGTYPATITVAAAGVTNTPQTISVSLTIAPPAAVPSITLNKTSLTATAVQGASPADDTFTVANGGTGALSYTVSSSAAWLTVSPVSGSSSGPANTHTVQFSTASLAEGTYPATITVAAAGVTNTPQTISVSLVIAAVSGGAGDPAAGQALYAQRCAGCHPSPAAIAGAADLMTTDLGTLSSAMDGIILTAQEVADLKAYLAGSTASTPTISLNRASLAPTAAPGVSAANDTFTVANGGTGTLDYTITSSVTWLTVSPASGSSSGSANTHTAQYSTASLAAGTYSATITVAAAAVTDTPQTISVSLTIAAVSSGAGNPAAGQALYAQRCAGCHPSPAAIAGAAGLITADLGPLSPAMTGIILTAQEVADLKAYLAGGSANGLTITLNKTSLAPTAVPGDSPVDESLSVANGGAGTLGYTITSSVTWLTVSPASGSSSGSANTHTVQYSTASLAEGTYPATITVTAAGATNSPQTITVSLSITAAGSSGAGDASVGQVLYAQRCAGCHPSTSAVAGAAGLITADLGPLSPAMTGITLTAQEVADLKAYLGVDSTGDPTIILDKAALTLAAGAGSSPIDDAFTVANGGTGTLGYTISSNVPWLTVLPVTGSSVGPANAHTVQYNTAALAAGTYGATITVNATEVVDLSQRISVSLTVTDGSEGRGLPGALCGMGALGIMPAVLLGLAGMRVGFVRRRYGDSRGADRLR